MSDQLPISENAETNNEKEMSFLGRLVAVFTSPGSAFQSIARKPGWFLPFIVLIVISLGNMVLMQPVIVKEQLVKTQEKLEKQGMDQEQIDNAITQSEKFMKILMYPSALIVTLIVILITAGIWLFLGNTILGGQANYKQMLSVVTFSGFIGLVGGLIKTPIILSQETMNVHFSLATFMSDDLVDTFLYKFLSQVELFNIWTVIALSIGIAVVSKLNVKKVWPWVAIVYLLFFAGSAALSSSFGG